MGKKEDRKKNDASFSGENQTTKMGSLPGTPKVKRKWSFGKTSGKEATHKFSKSLDSIDPSKLPIQAVAKSESKQSHSKALAVSRAIEYTSATKIQSVFRSYLVQINSNFTYSFFYQQNSEKRQRYLCLSSIFFYDCWVMFVSGKKSTACLEGTGEITSIGEGSPCEEANNCYYEAHACINGNPS